MLSPLYCSYTSICTGCDFLLKPYIEQQKIKREELATAWKNALPTGPGLGEVEWIAIDKGGLRDRFDFMIDQKSGPYKLGLFDRFKTGIADLQGCPQLSPKLESWYEDFRRVRIPVARGSVRLRVSPTGQRGVWLDLANIDVKSLLDERKTLDQLRELAVVEIGQRRKRLVEREGVLKLADPILEPWFETYTETGAVPLYCAIGSFTQPGFRANRALIETVLGLVKKTGAQTVMEFGAGIGNFTFPLASICKTTRVFEVDGLALQGLRRTANETGLASKIEINEGNFQAAKPVEFAGTDLVLVDPPRSGLQQF
jgi:23S rRNA (uracil1939-C5)-methyltransferase